MHSSTFSSQVSVQLITSKRNIRKEIVLSERFMFFSPWSRTESHKVSFASKRVAHLVKIMIKVAKGKPRPREWSSISLVMYSPKEIMANCYGGTLRPEPFHRVTPISLECQQDPL